MLREEQIDIRRQRAKEGTFHIQKLGRNRIFSDYQVVNPTTGGQYRVSIRGFDIGDNTCTCPDFKSNTLGTCKHIEAVLKNLADEAGPNIRRRKAAVTQPEIFLHYGEQLRLGLHLPPRYSDSLADLARRFFDAEGFWKGGIAYDELINAIHSVPEQVTVLSDALEFIDWEIERQRMARREVELLAEVANPESEFRRLLKVPLYDFQWRGAIFLACRGRCILGDDMGLGKTIQTLAAVEILVRERGIERVLVVAPASVKYQWETEIRKFTDRPVQVIEGLQDERRRQYAQYTFYRLVNYEQVLRDWDALNAWSPDLIVLDEAQRIKNWESKLSRSVKKLRSRYAIVLTGTPLENRLEELYSIVQFVDDRRLGPAFQFLHEHRVLDESGRLLGYRNLHKVREKLEPILLRRTRADVLQQLPVRTETTWLVELSDEQRRLYDEQRIALARLLQKKILTDLDRQRVLACLAALRMACGSTYLLDKTSDVSPKLDEFTQRLQELLEDSQRKIVVFSQWEMLLDRASQRLRLLDVPHCLLHGRIPARERRKLLDRFREGSDTRVLLSTDTGGTGLNLQAADTVINLEVPWNPAVLDQRIARVHRMGQSRPVQVLNFVTRGTIEERVVQVVEQKRALFSGVFTGDSDEVLLDALSQESFLNTVRELVGEVPEPMPTASDARTRLISASVLLLEAITELLGDRPPDLPPDVAARLGTVSQKLRALAE
ncbi:MAG: DEAD/DEAH box helicase [Gemmataceae bacterium]|nr:DEAD/DEAH box helicase [Gemmataceae bacterium]